jgi:hypothetical protein
MEGLSLSTQVEILYCKFVRKILNNNLLELERGKIFDRD